MQISSFDGIHEPGPVPGQKGSSLAGQELPDDEMNIDKDSVRRLESCMSFPVILAIRPELARWQGDNLT